MLRWDGRERDLALGLAGAVQGLEIRLGGGLKSCIAEQADVGWRFLSRTISEFRGRH